MKRWIAMAMMGALAACASRSSFDFVLKDGDAVEHVGSGADVTGEVSNAGLLTLEDSSWGLVMNLQGLSAGNHTLTMGSGEVQIRHKDTAETYKTSLGGSCTVWVHPHRSLNGSIVAGDFDCAGLVSAAGKQVDVTNGRFQVQINDVANNPKLNKQ